MIEIRLDKEIRTRQRVVRNGIYGIVIAIAGVLLFAGNALKYASESDMGKLVSITFFVDFSTALITASSLFYVTRAVCAGINRNIGKRPFLYSKIAVAINVLLLMFRTSLIALLIIQEGHSVILSVIVALFYELVVTMLIALISLLTYEFEPQW